MLGVRVSEYNKKKIVSEALVSLRLRVALIGIKLSQI